MAQIRIDLAETLVDGMDIKFKAPCACNEITGLIVYYPAEDETIQAKELFFRDAHGNDLTGMGNLFSKDAYVKVIADVGNGFAYIQNADNNGFLNSAIFGTYIHDAENLIGSGENGKFKATVSGTISSINVNGVNCSVKCGEDTSMDLIAGCWYTFILDGTTVNFSSGGAGAGLNFKVVGGATEPVSPSENMIWVNTEVAISSYMFAAVEPTSPAEGMVWISVGTSSTAEFNALKKNAIQVYPIAAKQYVDGAWVDVTGMIYQDGKLLSLEKTLFPPIDGWSITKMQSDRTMGTGTFGDNVFTGEITGGGQGIGITKQSVDFTNIASIDVFFSVSGLDLDAGDEGGMYVVITDGEYSDSGEIFSKSASNEENTKGVMKLDVDSISGTHRINVGIVSWKNVSASGSVAIRKLAEVAK